MIKKKRDSLELFIHDQLIGPGSCKGLYSLKHNNDKEENIGEIISTTPGSIYSSAILFPLNKDNSKKIADDIENDNDSLDIQIEDQEIDIDLREEKNDDEDLNSLTRRFPSSIGISCCLDSDLKNDNDLKITISGRYYTKLKQPTQLEVIIYEQNDFYTFFNTNQGLFDRWFIIENNKLSLKEIIPQNEIANYKNELKNLNIKIATEIAQNIDGSSDDIFNNIKQNYRYLSSYKERLFKKISSLTEDTYYNEEYVEIIKKRIEKIEQYETFFSYFEDLISICDNRNFGYWVEHPFSIPLDLSSLNLNISQYNNKVIYSPKKENCLKDIITVKINETTNISLSVWLQLIKLYDDRTYLKILLNNSSTEIITDSKHYYSIVSEMVNERCFFGIKIEATSKHLCSYKNFQFDSLDDEEAKNLNFLYRKIEDYGVGHFCSVNWTKDREGVIHIFSEFMPSVETPDVEPIPRDKFNEITDENGFTVPKPYLKDTQCLQFKWLSIFSETSDEEIKDKLLEFISIYKDWIYSQSNNIPNTEKEKNITACENDYKRMEQNIKEFLSDANKIKAFRIMNSAMFMQLWHNKDVNQQEIRETKKQTNIDFYKKASDKIFSDTEHAAWRPFQLAFILLNLDGIFKSKDDSNWSKRNELVDLVWFPTGGGKTEAYLGLIALTIINRRLTKGENGYGVTAIMRYTLRLLTTQQFQRALRLILALEQIRLWEVEGCNLGTEQISLGLFVGAQSLPNSLQDLSVECNKWESRNNSNNNSKIPLDKCPWCGSILKHQRKNNGEIDFYCENIYCTYDIGTTTIPVRLCDEDIYKYPPTLLFGTVDKFAQLAYKVDDNRINSDSRRLFGRGKGWEKLTPDLIIQDELHLLLGPLGSAVSLFECAIDILCTRHENNIRIRPKIISSTATTRNTHLQVRALYDREINIFPKNATDYDDSFFAFYKRSKKENEQDWSFIAKRKYIGILPTGRTQMTTQMRLAAIIFVHRAIFEKENLDNLNNEEFIKTADYYFSTISYFNSLKEVGKTDAQFYMEFTKYTRRLYKRVMRFSNMLECIYTYNERFSKSELTGRLSGNEAIAALNKAQSITWNTKRRFPYKDENGTWQRPIKPDDYILATNMISVGLDISRFNTIIMNSMPRNIAEYIQASSRVARDKEGLVLTLHNPFRSRDISHFEKFKEFHKKLYYYVEPISITPFSHKSVDKYLPLFLSVYIRHLFPNLANNKDANNLNNNDINAIQNNVVEYFSTRFKRTKELNGIEKDLLTKDLFDYIIKKTDELLKQWEDKKRNNNLVYSKYGRNNNTTPLFSSIEDYDEIREQNKWKVPTALRILEPEAVIKIQ